VRPPETALSLDTFAGKIQFRWAPDAEVSSFGQMAFFIEFLKTSGLFDNWVNDCPLQYSSANAPRKRDVLGRFCYPYFQDIGVTRISAHCETMESIPSC